MTHRFFCRSALKALTAAMPSAALCDLTARVLKGPGAAPLLEDGRRFATLFRALPWLTDDTTRPETDTTLFLHYRLRTAGGKEEDTWVMGINGNDRDAGYPEPDIYLLLRRDGEGFFFQERLFPWGATRSGEDARVEPDLGFMPCPIKSVADVAAVAVVEASILPS